MSCGLDWIYPSIKKEIIMYENLCDDKMNKHCQSCEGLIKTCVYCLEQMRKTLIYNYRAMLGALGTLC